MRSRATRSLAIGGLFLLGAMFPLAAAAEVTRDNFLVRTNADLVRLCSVEESDPLYQAAIGFCHGYVVGAHHYHLALTEHSQPHPKPCEAR